MLSYAARADFELTGPSGRRILLKDNGTWQYVESKDKDLADDKAKEKGETVLQLERKIDLGTRCRFGVRLANNLPYEVRSLVLYYAAYRANGVVIETVSSAVSFNSLNPGDMQRREFEFTGAGCKDIVRVQVVGGDRCDMGDLTRFSADKGVCLARVRVVESDLVRFDK